MSMWKRWPLLLAATLMLASCFEERAHYTILPDGSGKVIYERILAPKLIGSGDHDLRGEMGPVLAALIENSEGIDAWTDVEIEPIGSGQVCLRGTAYFPDIRELEIDDSSLIRWRWIRKGSGGRLEADLEEQEEKIAAEKERLPLGEAAQYQATRPMVAAALANVRQQMSFRMPGTVSGRRVFRENPDEVERLRIDGLEMLVAAEQRLRRAAGDGDRSPVDLELSMFEDPEGPMLRVDAMGAASFDYESEVDRARRNPPDLKALVRGLPTLKKEDGPLPAPPEPDAMLRDPRVVSLRWLSPQAAGRVGGSRKSGYELVIQAKLDGPVLHLTRKDRVLRIVGGDGKRLTGASIRSSLESDKRTILATVALGHDSIDLRSIEHLSAAVRYQVLGSMKTIELGLAGATEGLRGKALGARIVEEVEFSRTERERTFKLALDIDHPDDLIRIRARNGTFHRTLPIRGRGREGGWSDKTGSCVFTLRIPADVDDWEDLVVELRDEIEERESVFVLEDLDLLPSTPTSAK